MAQTGRAQTEVGEKWSLFAAAVQNRFMAPMHDFMANDIKAVSAERKALNTARLDLDVARTRARKQGQPPEKQQQVCAKRKRPAQPGV